MLVTPEVIADNPFGPVPGDRTPQLFFGDSQSQTGMSELIFACKDSELGGSDPIRLGKNTLIMFGS